MDNGLLVCILIQAQAEVVRAEGMKAENQSRTMRGDYPPYTEWDFLRVVDTLEALAKKAEAL